MGYTNYWIRTEKPITQSFVDAVKSIVSEANKMGISIRGWDGDGEPEITLDYIGFNGNKRYNLDHETCFFNNIASDRGFNFCKTARKPYDWVVKQVLKEAEKEGINDHEGKRIHHQGSNSLRSRRERSYHMPRNYLRTTSGIGVWLFNHKIPGAGTLRTYKTR